VFQAPSRQRDGVSLGEPALHRKKEQHKKKKMKAGFLGTRLILRLKGKLLSRGPLSPRASPRAAEHNRTTLPAEGTFQVGSKRLLKITSRIYPHRHTEHQR